MYGVKKLNGGINLKYKAVIIILLSILLSQVIFADENITWLNGY